MDEPVEFQKYSIGIRLPPKMVYEMLVRGWMGKEGREDLIAQVLAECPEWSYEMDLLVYEYGRQKDAIRRCRWTTEDQGDEDGDYVESDETRLQRVEAGAFRLTTQLQRLLRRLDDDGV